MLTLVSTRFKCPSDNVGLATCIVVGALNCVETSLARSNYKIMFTSCIQDENTLPILIQRHNTCVTDWLCDGLHIVFF